MLKANALSQPPLAWFDAMIGHCHASAMQFRRKGGHLVGILCEYTPRELILAAGAWPVCLCGGDAEMIPAAETVLPANVCPLIKSTFGYSLKKANPFLKMADLVVAETTCDGKKKMYELLAQRHPLYILELPQKSGDADARAHWLLEMCKLRKELEKRFKTKITDSKLRAAIRLMNQERRLRRALAVCMKNPAPPLSGTELLNLKSLISGLPEDLKQYEVILQHLPSRPEKQRPAKDAVRVLLTGVPCPHGAERVVALLEQEGGIVVCQENCTGIKPILNDVAEVTGDPMEALADFYWQLPCSVMTPNTRRFEQIRQLVNDYKPACIVELVWQCCLTYDIECAHTKAVAKELQLPYLRIETDYSPSDDRRLALRIAALYEMTRR